MQPINLFVLLKGPLVLRIKHRAQSTNLFVLLQRVLGLAIDDRLQTLNLRPSLQDKLVFIVDRLGDEVLHKARSEQSIDLTSLGFEIRPAYAEHPKTFGKLAPQASLRSDEHVASISRAIGGRLGGDLVVERPARAGDVIYSRRETYTSYEQLHKRKKSLKQRSDLFRSESV